MQIARMWKLVVVLLAFIAAISAVDYTSDNCLNSIAIGRDRPRVVQIQLSRGFAALDVHVSMARHHIVPYNALRQFFNTIVAHGTRTLQDRLYEFIANLGRRVLNTDIPDFYTTVYERRMELLRSVNGVPEEFDIDAYNNLNPNVRVMHQLFAWMPFNIFEGPAGNYRSDDPGPLFEISCREVIGDQLFRQLQLINGAIREYELPPHTVAFGEQTLHLLEESLNMRSQAFVFDHQHWFVRFERRARPNQRRQGHTNIEVRFELRTPENRRLQSEHPDLYYDVDPNNRYPCFGNNVNIRVHQYYMKRLFMGSSPQVSDHRPIQACYMKLFFPSTVYEDPICLMSMTRTLEGIKNQTLLREYDDNHKHPKIWDIKDLQLMETNKLVQSVGTFQSSNYASWKEWVKHEPFHYVGNLLFKDNSFAIEYFLPCIISKGSTCTGVTIFDPKKRPIARLRGEDKIALVYRQGQWQGTKSRDWYSWVNTTDIDFAAPRFNVTIRMGHAPSRVEKSFLHEQCTVPVLSAGMIGGASTGFVLGTTVFPVVGSMVGGFVGFASGLLVGMFSGTVIADKVCT